MNMTMQLPKSKAQEGLFSQTNDGLIHMNQLNKITEERENNVSSPLLSYMRNGFSSPLNK